MAADRTVYVKSLPPSWGIFREGDRRPSLTFGSPEDAVADAVRNDTVDEVVILDEYGKVLRHVTIKRYNEGVEYTSE